MSSALDQHDALVAAGILLYAFDAAYPAPASVYKANGGIAANVYVSGNFARDAAHVQAMRAGGIAPWPGYEVALWELVSNRAAGQNAARRAIPDALRCGFPANGTIWFQYSVDVSVDPTRYHEVGDAFQGIKDINAGRFLTSFYGQGALASYLRANGIINQKCWLSASSSFPGWNPNSPDICMWQQIGNFIPGYSTDRNVITDVQALHAWWPPGSPYAQGGDMLDPADPIVVEIRNHLVWLQQRVASESDGLTTGQKQSEYNWLRYLFFAFDVGPLRTQTPQGEFGLALRQLRDNFGHLATDADVTAITTLLGDVHKDVADVHTDVAAVHADQVDLNNLIRTLTLTFSDEQIAVIVAALIEHLPAVKEYQLTGVLVSTPTTAPPPALA